MLLFLFVVELIMSSIEKQKTKQRRKDFLLSFFSKPDKFEHKEVNGFVLVKHYNGQLKNWYVDIYTPDTFQNFINRSKVGLPIGTTPLFCKEKEEITMSVLRVVREELSFSIIYMNI